MKILLSCNPSMTLNQYKANQNFKSLEEWNKHRNETNLYFLFCKADLK